jgi:predicted amidohydrolase
MHTQITVAQLQVEQDIAKNKNKILSVLNAAQQNEWIIFPECMLTGYFPEKEDFLRDINTEELESAIAEISHTVRNRHCYCLLGTAAYLDGAWYNATVIQEPTGLSQIYRKIALSELDKRHFQPGTAANVYTVNGIKIGVQTCRELIFPEPWMQLRKQGAQIVFHTNNAIKPYDKVWEHIIITRAVENGYYVCSVNNAAKPQALTSYLVAPNGEVLLEGAVQKEQSLTQEIDLAEAHSKEVVAALTF